MCVKTTCLILTEIVTIFTGLMDTMKQADQSNWCLNHEQFADLASSLSTFFNQSGLLPTITPPTTTSKNRGTIGHILYHSFFFFYQRMLISKLIISLITTAWLNILDRCICSTRFALVNMIYGAKTMLLSLKSERIIHTEYCILRDL